MNGISRRKATSDVDEEVYGNDFAERHEAQEASAGDRRAIADADQARQLDISGETKTARILRTPEPPTDVRERHTTRHMFHSKIGARSVLRVVDDDGYTAEIPDRLHVHSKSGREQNSAMHHFRGNAQWSSDQLDVRAERWL